MITLEMAKSIAQKEFPDLPISGIINIGDKWAFNYGGTPDPDLPIFGIPADCANKSNGEAEYLTISPITNLEILNKGIVIYSTGKGNERDRMTKS